MRQTLLTALALLGFLLAACSKHEDQLRAEGLREVSGKVFLASDGKPNVPLAQVVVAAVDWDQCVKNFKKLKDQHAASKAKNPLEVKDYWQVLGNTVKGMKTDAAGEFKMTVPAKQSLVLCASTTHDAPGGGIAWSYWLIQVTEAPVQRFELSSRNSLADTQKIEDMIIVN